MPSAVREWRDRWIICGHNLCNIHHPIGWLVTSQQLMDLYGLFFLEIIMSWIIIKELFITCVPYTNCVGSTSSHYNDYHFSVIHKPGAFEFIGWPRTSFVCCCTSLVSWLVWVQSRGGGGGVGVGVGVGEGVGEGFGGGGGAEQATSW